jgi:Flp pilus assembly protein TadD
MGRYPDAITEFKKVVALDFKNAEAHYNLGLAYSRNGENARAREELAAACRLNPNSCRKQPR